jgi:hypothetical protein
MGARTVQINRIAVRDAHTDRLLRSWSGSQVAGLIAQIGVPSLDTLGPHEAATAYLGVLLRGGATPRRLVHEFDVTLTPPPENVVFNGQLHGALTRVITNPPPVKLGPPLIGATVDPVRGPALRFDVLPLESNIVTFSR